MNRISLSITAVVIILLLLLAACLWHRRHFLLKQPNIICVMMLPRAYYLFVGIIGILFSCFFVIPSIIFLDGQMIYLFLCFYPAMLLGIYCCILAFLWTCVVTADSLTFYLPLFPPKEFRFDEITSVKYTENRLLGGGGKKRLEGYRQSKKIFIVEESTIGFDVLYAVLQRNGKLDYIPFGQKDKDASGCVPVLEDFSITESTENVVRSITTFLLFGVLGALAVWIRDEVEWIYVLISVFFALFSLVNMLNTLIWKVTIGFRSISVRNSFGRVKTYEIRQITEIQETQDHLVLYAGDKKIVKIFKNHKNTAQLAERLQREGIEIHRVY